MNGTVQRLIAVAVGTTLQCSVARAAEIETKTLFATLETEVQRTECYQLCERSFTEVLDAPTKDSLKICEARQKCVSRLPWDPEHGYVAGMPRDQPYDLEDILQRFIGVDIGVDGSGQVKG
jgi:hypothetical protein